MKVFALNALFVLIVGPFLLLAYALLGSAALYRKLELRFAYGGDAAKRTKAELGYGR